MLFILFLYSAQFVTSLQNYRTEGKHHWGAIQTIQDDYYSLYSPAVSFYQNSSILFLWTEWYSQQIYFNLYDISHQTTSGYSKTLFKSKEAPSAIADFKGNIFAAWKGANGKLTYSIYSTNKWESQKELANSIVDSGISLANINGRIFASWTTKTQLIYSMYNSTTKQWAPIKNIENSYSDFPLGATKLDESTLFLIWKDKSSEAIAMKTYNANSDNFSVISKIEIDGIKSQIIPLLVDDIIYISFTQEIEGGYLWDSDIYYELWNGIINYHDNTWVSYPSKMGDEYGNPIYSRGPKVSLSERNGLYVMSWNDYDYFPSFRYSLGAPLIGADWMALFGRIHPQFKEKSLKSVILPSTHDSAMYGSFLNNADTQESSVGKQLLDGIRVFDFRITMGMFGYTAHHSGNLASQSTISTGEYLSNVLEEMKLYMERINNKETLLLMFSHFGNYFEEQGKYEELTEFIKQYLDDYLVIIDNSTRISEIPLKNLEGKIILVSNKYADQIKIDKMYWYSESNTESQPKVVDNLIVYNEYSNTEELQALISDQRYKYLDYNGNADLFLVSWSLTPSFGIRVFHIATDANDELYNEMMKWPIPNEYGRIPNIISVDYYEYGSYVVLLSIELNTKLSS